MIKRAYPHPNDCFFKAGVFSWLQQLSTRGPGETNDEQNPFTAISFNYKVFLSRASLQQIPSL